MANTDKKTKFIMIQGTMSNAGKSLVVAGLCRIFKQDGYKVAPFKSQNMALNSFITEDGLEMGRAQVMQAEAAGTKPTVYMNPILLKPTNDVGSQVIVNGKVLGNMKARDYFAYKKQLIPDIERAIAELGREYEIIVIEGAGSPAEINLKENDIVNMGMAKIVDAPVLLVGDIDRGGVFAQLYGTLELLEKDERDRVKGLIINKFRGDKTILDPGIEMIEEKGKVPVTGVLPYIDISIEDEDSLSERFEKKKNGCLDIAVIKLPYISNFTDFNVFDEFKEVAVRYIRSVKDMGEPDMLIIPGSKSTVADMRWLSERGFDAAIQKYAEKDGIIFGICGGFQMLGERIEDPFEVETGGETKGIGLLPVTTTLLKEKTRMQTTGCFGAVTGDLSGLTGLDYEGYEIHMGQTKLTNSEEAQFTGGETGVCSGNVYGTYIHGIFDGKGVAASIVASLAGKKGVSIDTKDAMDYESFKESQYDALADMMREHMDMNYVYSIMGLEGRK